MVTVDHGSSRSARNRRIRKKLAPVGGSVESAGGQHRDFAELERVDCRDEGRIGIWKNFVLRGEMNRGRGTDKRHPRVFLYRLNFRAHNLVAVAETVENIGNDRDIELV